MKRHVPQFAPEVAPTDLESPANFKAFGGGKPISLGGAPAGIQPYQFPSGHHSKGSGSAKGSGPLDSETLKKYAAIAGAIWLGGCFFGFDWYWPLYVLLELLYTILSIPPFSWFFGWIWTPLSWISGLFHRGAPVVNQMGALQELRLPTDQVATYVDTYVQQYGDAALIFASHDGYPQLVSGLLLHSDLGYRDLLDAADDNGNTALLYASAKGFRQCSAMLLRNGADPDIANSGNGGRTPLMESAGAGHKDIVTALRLSNASINAVDSYGNTALHYAAYHGHLSVVHELLKSSPRKDIKNQYGHTAASYAASNKHKAIADLLNRGPSKRERALAAAREVPEQEEEEPILPAVRKPKEEKHVKGNVEDLHKRDWKNFAPKLDKPEITDSERKSLEEQIAKLKRQHEEAELKAQKKIVELLEKHSDQQRTVDDADRERRTLRLNNTELSMRAQELQSKHQASELKAMDEKQRADRLNDELQRIQSEIEHHKRRADDAERERDLHMDASKRHQDSLMQKQTEVSEHLSRLGQQSRDMNALRDDLRRKEDDVRQFKSRIEELQKELKSAKSIAGSAVRAQEDRAPPAAFDIQPSNTGSEPDSATNHAVPSEIDQDPQVLTHERTPPAKPE